MKIELYVFIIFPIVDLLEVVHIDSEAGTVSGDNFMEIKCKGAVEVQLLGGIVGDQPRMVEVVVVVTNMVLGIAEADNQIRLHIAEVEAS